MYIGFWRWTLLELFECQSVHWDASTQCFCTSLIQMIESASLACVKIIGSVCPSVLLTCKPLHELWRECFRFFKKHCQFFLHISCCVAPLKCTWRVMQVNLNHSHVFFWFCFLLFLFCRPFFKCLHHKLHQSLLVFKCVISFKIILYDVHHLILLYFFMMPHSQYVLSLILTRAFFNFVYSILKEMMTNLTCFYLWDYRISCVEGF